MKSPFILVALVAVLTGCVQNDGRAQPIGNAVIGVVYSKHCIEGVTYLQADRGLTVQLDRNGKVIPCP